LPYATLLAAPAVLYASARRWHDLGRFATAGIVVAAAVLAGTVLGTGQWSPYTGDRYWYPSAVPYATAHADGGGVPYSKIALLTDWGVPAVRAVVVNGWYFLVGRFSGLLLYFPTLFACGLWATRGDRVKVAWLGAAGACCLLLVALMPHNPLGGTHALGNRLFVLLPVALILIDVVALIPWRVALTAILLVPAVPIMLAPVDFSLHPGRRMLLPPYRWFPVEWPQAAAVTFPYSFPGLMALTANQFDWEASAGGVWTVGGTRAEFALIRPAGTPATVGLSSRLPEARVSDGPTRRVIRFSTGKMETVTLRRPRAIFRHEGDGFREYAVYQLVVETGADVTPAAQDCGDPRHRGVFVQPLT
jgi:hypothetical protein